MQLVRNSSSFLLFPPVCSEQVVDFTPCPHPTAARCSGNKRRPKHESQPESPILNTLFCSELERKIPFLYVILHLCDPPELATDTLPLLAKLLSIVCSHACKQHLERRVGETTSQLALWQCFCPRRLIGYDISTPKKHRS